MTTRPDGLPDDYDMDKEPVVRYRMAHGGQSSWSGNSYVAVLLNGEHRPGRVQVVADSRHCDHGTTICRGTHEDGQPCAESWQYDYSILWSRTAAGRKMISDLGVQADKNQNADHPAAVYNRRNL